MAPDSFLNALPCCPLDGELWAGRGNFELCRSICGGDEPDDRFDQISYAVYSSPAMPQIFRRGEIKGSNFVLDVNPDLIEGFVCGRLAVTGFDFLFVDPAATYEGELLFLRGALETQNDHVFLHQQVKLPDDEEAARQFADEYMAKILDRGGEGCVIRDPKSRWTPKRHTGLLKFKPYKDAEAVVLGYVAGKEGKQGNVLGKIGALKVRTLNLRANVEFEIGSGLTFEEREFASYNDTRFASHHPGEDMPEDANSRHLPVGSIITFKYRELSADGIPKEGRYWRRRAGVE
jgi:DNA ligase-1